MDINFNLNKNTVLSYDGKKFKDREITGSFK